MTSDQAQIQALIDGIDEALNKTNPRLPWVMSNDAAQQRQVLEQTRQYLTSLQQQADETESPPADEATASRMPAALEATPSPSESAQQVLQAVLQEMNYWRVNMLQPLRTEIDSLQRQREMLTQEIRQLEGRRQPHLGAQPNQQLLMEFLQSAMAQMQANLSNQVTQMIAGQMQASGQPALSASSLTPAERLAQLQTAQMQSDQLMLKLDSTLQVIFESLNRNVQTYEESLEQGLNRMHSLGQQGEAMFAFLVNRLAQQLGREASTFLQASAGNLPQSSPLPVEPQADSKPEAPAVSEVTESKASNFLSQIPASQSTFVPAVPFDLSEEVLDISELELDQPLDQPLPDNLEGLDLELSQLDLSAIPPIEPEASPLDLFAGDQPLSASETPASVEPLAARMPIVNDLDSALDLLNQLSAEMQTSLAMEPETPPHLPTLSNETELITVPDSLYDDAFYSMADATDRAREVAEPPSDALPIDAMTLEEAWFDGLGDPAAESPSEPTSELDFADSLVNQSLENFLLNNPAPAITELDLFAEFAEPSTPAQPDAIEAESVAEATPTETITRLTDLIPSDLSNSDSSDPDLKATEPQPGSQPSEPLPIAEAPSEVFQVDLGRDADMLAELDADLAQFGSSTNSPEPTETEPTDTAWDFADLPPADPANSSPATADEPAVTVEGLEDLFADLPLAENSPQIEAAPDLFAQLKAAFSQDAGTPLETEQPIVLKYLDSDADPADASESDAEKKK